MTKYLTQSILLIALISCQSKETTNTVQIYSLHDEQALAEFNLLDLDAKYSNLLDPAVSGDRYEDVTKSWAELHQTVGNKLQERGFSWEMEATNVKLINRIYFNQDSEISHYAYRILGDVSAEKISEFQSHIQEILPQVSIGLKRDTPFAQCGKVSYESF